MEPIVISSTEPEEEEPVLGIGLIFLLSLYKALKPFKEWMSTKEMSNIQLRCWKFIQTTRFNDNTVYDENENIKTAFEKAVNGNDAGKQGILNLMPLSTDAKAWFDYFVLTYYLYSRNK